MIDTNLLLRWRAPSGQRGRVRARRGGLAGEEGLTLIEVMVSALMVGFIAIATFNGFSVATGATADERFHDQAAVLAAQSQEELRSDSAYTLDTLQQTSAHVYTQTLGGEKYTITQSDKWISDINQNASCSATGEEHSSQAGNYLQVHTEVTWPQQLATGEHALEQYSIITPPDGSGLEVDALNGRTPKLPVPGVTVISRETGPPNKTSTATTGEAGCVIFGGIPATRVNVEAFKIGDVTEKGAIKKVDPEVLVAPNITTHAEVVLNQGAAVTAEFTHAGKTTFEGKPVTGDTFVVRNSKLEPEPNFELGSTRFGAFGGEGEYDALPGEIEATPGKSYMAAATSPISAAYYPTGDLFPFEAQWSVYAGDCPENNPHRADESEFTESSVPSVALEPGQNATVKVPTSMVTLETYKGTKIAKGEVESTLRPVKITNTGCQKEKEEKEKETKKAYIPDNASAFNTTHTQDTTAEGHLEAPFQPFGKSFKLCLWDHSLEKTYTVTTYANETVTGPTLEIFLAEPGPEYEDVGHHKIQVKKLQSTNTC